MNKLRNPSLNVDSINNIYMELGRTNHWRVLIIISEFIKHNLDTCEDEWLSRSGERELWSKIKLYMVKTCKHILHLFSNYQCGTAFPNPSLGHFFSPNKVHRLSNYIDLEKRIWPIYNTVDSPLFPGSLRGHSLYVIIWPLGIPLSIITSTGKSRWISNSSI